MNNKLKLPRLSGPQILEANEASTMPADVPVRHQYGWYKHGIQSPVSYIVDILPV